MGKEFEIVFIKEAKDDYQKLDGSEKKYIDIALAKIRYRADEIGETLTNKGNTDLVGCKKIKLRKIGLRIVFRIVGDSIEVVEIIAIGKRRNDEVYKNAMKRLQHRK